MNDDEKRKRAAMVAEFLYHELGAKSVSIVIDTDDSLILCSGGGKTVGDEAGAIVALTRGLAMLIEERTVPDKLPIIAEEAAKALRINILDLSGAEKVPEDANVH